MKRLMSGGLAVLTTVLIAGCEWQAVKDEDSWNSNVTQMNFSGTYRGTGPNGFIVSDYATSGGSGGGNTTVIVVQNEPAGSKPASQTEMSGQFPGAKVPIVPGSVTIYMEGLISAGSFTDDGAGGLSGTFNLVGIDAPTHTGTGTIDYDTGVWTLSLDSPGFLETVNVFLSWSYTVDNTVIAIDPEPGNSGDPVYAFTVSQTGNILSFIDSQGSEYAGEFSIVSTAGGDPTGGTSGEVVGSFQVLGTSKAGFNVTITGTFQGTYTAPTVAGGYGTLTGRIITGTWVEQGGRTGDVRGKSDETVAVETPTTTPTT